MQVTVRIEGTADYLQNQFVISEEEAGGVKKKKSTGKGGTPVEQKVYKNEKGCYIPAAQILKAIEDASARLIKKGKQTWREDFRAGVLIEELEIPFSPAKKTYDRVFVVAGRIPPRTGARVPISRPLFAKGWKAEFTLQADDDIPFTVLKEVLDIAGSKKGLGDWRPQYGRFKVVKALEIK